MQLTHLTHFSIYTIASGPSRFCNGASVIKLRIDVGEVSLRAIEWFKFQTEGSKKQRQF